MIFFQEEIRYYINSSRLYAYFPSVLSAETFMDCVNIIIKYIFAFVDVNTIKEKSFYIWDIQYFVYQNYSYK